MSDKTTKLGVWFAKHKNGTLLLFTSEPKREGDGWVGNFYVNSVIHENLQNMLKGSSFSNNDEAQYIEFQLAVQP